MTRHVACLLPICFIVASVGSVRAGVDEDLGTIYATSAAKLAHEGDLARRVETVLRKQSRYIATQLRPWKQDPHALALFKAGSLEGDIRSNAHAAFWFAVLWRA